jgi:hypothetical protein
MTKLPKQGRPLVRETLTRVREGIIVLEMMGTEQVLRIKSNPAEDPRPVDYAELWEWLGRRKRSKL